MPAWRSAAAWCTLLAVFAVGLCADLVSKSWAFETVAGAPVDLSPREVVADPAYRLPWHAGVRALPGDLLDFHLVVNHGAVFGIGQHAREWFIGFTVLAVSAGVVIFGWWTRASSRLAHIGLGLILAGGIGNLYDRFVFGAVRDFLHMFPRWNLPFGLAWPGGNREVFPWVFNIADVMLLAGMALLVIHAHREDARRAREAKAAGAAAEASPERTVAP